MVPINGRPFLEYQLELIRRFGCDRVLLLVGHLAEYIERYFQNGTRWNLVISYSKEPSPLGTAGALKLASAQLEDQFLLLNGDTYLAIDYREMMKRFSEQDGTCGMMAVYANPDGIAPNNVEVSGQGMVVRYDKTRSEGLTHVDAGAYVFRKRILDLIPSDAVASLEEDVFPQLASRDDLAAYPVQERYYDIGTFERLAVAKKAIS